MPLRPRPTSLGPVLKVREQRTSAGRSTFSLAVPTRVAVDLNPFARYTCQVRDGEIVFTPIGAIHPTLKGHRFDIKPDRRFRQ